MALHAVACHRVRVSFVPLAVKVGSSRRMEQDYLRYHWRYWMDAESAVRKQHSETSLPVALWHGNAAFSLIGWLPICFVLSVCCCIICMTTTD